MGGCQLCLQEDEEGDFEFQVLAGQLVKATLLFLGRPDGGQGHMAGTEH